MSYQPYLISNFSTGLEQDKQPWLLADDAQEFIYDGYIQHGVIKKRDGYNYFATGGESSAPYCESRIVRATSVNMTGTVDGANKIFTTTIGAASRPIRRGNFIVTSSTPAQSMVDNGIGTFTGDGTGTIDYLTGVVSIIFTTAPTVPDPIVATFDYHPGLPVMMVANFVTNTNSTQLIVADTDFLNRYNANTNRLDDITNRVYTGDKSNFFSWVQYPTIEDNARLLFVNNKDPIQSYDETNVEDFYPVYETTAVSGESYALGDGTMGPYLHTASNLPVFPGSVSITEAVSAQTVTDDGDGNLTGDGTGTINYLTGAMSVTFTANVVLNDPILVAYSWESGQILTCLLMRNFKDRLICLRTTETGGTIYPQRIRISGTGQSGDDFRTSATGAGVIDIPDQNWIMGAEFSRDDLLIYTTKTTWILKYTGNDIVPFTLDKIDGTRGNEAPFAPISYLNMSKAYSRYGFTLTDGYQVQRYDDRIPNYCFDGIDQENFNLCFSGAVDDDQMHYLIHPGPDQSKSDLILVNNYEENTFSIYRIPMSCMGTFFESFDTTWTDLLVDYPDAENAWDQFAQDYATWNDLSYSKDTPISIGGGHFGEIWRLNKDEGEDNTVRIYDLTIDSSNPLVLNVTTDWNNYKEGDFIYFAGVGGSVEVNSHQGYIPTGGITDNHNFQVQFASDDLTAITAFTSGGTVSRTIPFEIVSKNFNPYSELGMKVRCGWMYLYTDTTETLLVDIDDIDVPPQINIEIFSNDSDQPTQVTTANLPYRSNISNFTGRNYKKKWTKIFINQTGEFIQFNLSNTQPGTRIRIQAMMPGFMQTGRLL